MTESDLKTDRLQEAADGKRPWGTPRIIESQLARRTMSATPTSTPFPDGHTGSGTVMLGS